MAIPNDTPAMHETMSATPQLQPGNPQSQQQKPLNIIQVSSEMAPLAKVGGLGDVVTGLSHELENLGHSVEIILPKYDCMHYDQILGFTPYVSNLQVPWYQGHISCTVWFGYVEGRRCYFIDAHSEDNFFNRGCIYGHQDDISRFAFFSRAALEFIYQSGRHPDIIHCHDWPTALVPVLLYEIYQGKGLDRSRVCFTIHNFKHQGLCGEFILTATGLGRPEYFCQTERLLDNQQPYTINLMKGAIVYSNFITTVSPKHAFEAKEQDQGFGLKPTLQYYHMKFGGVINGVDYSVWNPETDRLIEYHYSADNLDGKYSNKRRLRQHFMLEDNAKPLVAFIGRLDPQKGLDLVRHAIFYCLEHGAQFVLLGSSPDDYINAYFRELKSMLNDNPDCHLELQFNNTLAHHIYAGADIMLVPSQFEPCGLTQLIAMRYGTIPVVRAVGGLADTVHDKHFAEIEHENRNGFVFEDYNNAGLESALSRGLNCYYNETEHFRTLIRQAMRHDYSWSKPCSDYLNIYRYIQAID